MWAQESDLELLDAAASVALQDQDLPHPPSTFSGLRNNGMNVN